MRSWILPLTLTLLAPGGLFLRTAAAADDGKLAPVPATAYKTDVLPMLQTHCVRCHTGEKPKAGLKLDEFPDEAAALQKRKVWEKVVRAIRAGEMPPPTRPSLKADEQQKFFSWVDARLYQVDCGKSPDPGRVTIRRLNRAEYNNTIRDLVGIDFQPAADFPADDVGYGFDNIGDVLSMPPILMEKYLTAAEKITEEAFKNPAVKNRIIFARPSPVDRRERMGQRVRDEAHRKVIEAFATRAYRRPVDQFEVSRLVRLAKQAEPPGDTFEKGIQLAIQAVLVSPHFLFRVEIDRYPSEPTKVHPISDFELATRMSYFLWSSMPDEELFALAKDGKLREPGVVENQIRRMLRDPKARALTDNFAGQWLQLRNLKTIAPDPDQFPAFTDALRTAMQRETEMFFEAVMKEDRSILDFIDADFTFLNEALAKHYGVPGVKGSHFRKVQLKDGRRGGVLTQASVLSVTSNPTRTSPVKRGKWIMENILGTPPPPPPAGVVELSEAKEVVDSAPLRVRMEQHRSDPNCASCHTRMDTLGFAFENFNVIGAWRDKDGKFPIDPSGLLPGGQSFRDPAELKKLLLEQRDDFARCLIEKMLTYGLGRGVEYYDKCAMEAIGKNLAQQDYKFSALVIEIVKSDPFQKRRAKRGDE